MQCIGLTLEFFANCYDNLAILREKKDDGKPIKRAKERTGIRPVLKETPIHDENTYFSFEGIEMFQGGDSVGIIQMIFKEDGEPGYADPDNAGLINNPLKYGGQMCEGLIKEIKIPGTKNKYKVWHSTEKTLPEIMKTARKQGEARKSKARGVVTKDAGTHEEEEMDI